MKREVKWICIKNKIWQETAIWLKHYRTKYWIEEYNLRKDPLIALYRKIELELDNFNYISEFEYRDMIKKLNKDFEKGK